MKYKKTLKIFMSFIFLMLATNLYAKNNACYFSNMENEYKIYVISISDEILEKKEKDFYKYKVVNKISEPHILFLTSKSPVLWLIDNQYRESLKGVTIISESYSDYVKLNKSVIKEEAFSLGRSVGCKEERRAFFGDVNYDLNNIVEYMTGRKEYYFIKGESSNSIELK